MAFFFTGFADEASKALDEQIAVTRQAGWNSIEIRKIGDRSCCALTPDEWKQVWEQLQAGGITIAGFGSAIANRKLSADLQEDIDDLKRAIPYMHEAGCKLVRIMSYRNDIELSHDEFRSEAVRRLKALCEIAEGNGIILGHENCSGYASRTAESFFELVEAVDSPALKMILDTGNTTGHHGLGYEGTWDYYEKCRDMVVHVHIKSFHKNDEDKWVTCYPDEDPLQARILADLKKNGYDGWFSIEPHLKKEIPGLNEAEAAEEVYLEYTRRLEKVVNGLS